MSSPNRSVNATPITTTFPPQWSAGDNAVVLGGSAQLAEYVDGANLDPVLSRRPFLHPVRTLAGTPLTDVGPEDHRHHLGLSAALPDVNGTSFWGGRTFVRDQGSTLLPNHGSQRVVDTEIGDGGNVLVQHLVWDDENDAPLLSETRTIQAIPLPADDAWVLRWTSALTADRTPLVFGSPATNGRPGAGYGGIFWRLGDADSTEVFSVDGPGEEIAHGSLSPWVAFVQRTNDTTATLILIQSGDSPWNWFLRSTEYSGAGPAVAWDATRHLPQGEKLELGLVAVLVDHAISPDELPAVVDRAIAALA